MQNLGRNYEGTSCADPVHEPAPRHRRDRWSGPGAGWRLPKSCEAKWRVRTGKDSEAYLGTTCGNTAATETRPPPGHAMEFPKRRNGLAAPIPRFAGSCPAAISALIADSFESPKRIRGGIPGGMRNAVRGQCGTQSGAMPEGCPPPSPKIFTETPNLLCDSEAHALRELIFAL